MLDRALKGSSRYWGWLIFLLVLMGIGFACYLYQFKVGLKITGMSRDVSWGLYISQLTYLVGVAASGVMVVLPYYLHDYKAFGRITILGEFMAIAAVLMCLLFVMVDLGKLPRLMNIIMYPHPKSILFWDMIVLNGYLILNILIGWNVLAAERKGVHYSTWVKVLIYISIPWAFSIHTVTAFLYAGLPGRHFWLTAIMAPRFLASAFCSGPAILLLIALVVRKFTNFDPGKEQIRTLGGIIAYAFIINIFFFLMEIFTSFYSQIPGHMHSFVYLFLGLDGYGKLAPWMWTFVFFAIVALILLIIPSTRRKEDTLAIACAAVVISTWIDKGLGLIIGGFVPNPFERVFEYWPTTPEVLITIGVWAMGFFVLTVLFKIAVSIKEEVAA
ncbi:MAG: polysulfide reductase NrfD [Deltaproteobacteria bacterium]|nr:polysulfide reductase NrfD [Deltaproteobacteria bacterium]MBW1927977.1 polysulfide reductase NrfD [Deltaproteobacteria bacterium]MBW2025990.1 polysulfide reductase NrfD [Deltaproteobacteria bacterium]MBW2125755.1 polysulfide reductase NrfD [Deltaproteobacteria bacterium]RLB16811.1 MAG: menaquinol oxidoreductase [Deltaproteobacteria bacterium]